MAPFLQWPALHDAGFDVRCASIDEDDRSTFDELVTAASSYIDREACDRPCLLVGESFGGALATVVAQHAPNVEGVVLVNPATCYAESALASKAPPILELPAWAYYVGLASLLPLFVDRHGVRALFDIVTNKRLPCVIETPRQEAYMGRVALSLPERIARMPRGTLAWRLREWLDVGAKVDVGALAQPTLVVFGDEDNTLPSEREAARVGAVLTTARAARVPGAGPRRPRDQRRLLDAHRRQVLRQQVLRAHRHVLSALVLGLMQLVVDLLSLRASRRELLCPGSRSAAPRPSAAPRARPRSRDRRGRWWLLVGLGAAVALAEHCYGPDHRQAARRCGWQGSLATGRSTRRSAGYCPAAAAAQQWCRSLGCWCGEYTLTF